MNVLRCENGDGEEERADANRASAPLPVVGAGHFFLPTGAASSGLL